MQGKAAALGRPTGSTNGRIPAGGYPPVSDAFGAFLAGFIEGEGSFLILRQSRGQNHRCSMRLWPLAKTMTP